SASRATAKTEYFRMLPSTPWEVASLLETYPSQIDNRCNSYFATQRSAVSTRSTKVGDFIELGHFRPHSQRASDPNHVQSYRPVSRHHSIHQMPLTIYSGHAPTLLLSAFSNRTAQRRADVFFRRESA